MATGYYAPQSYGVAPAPVSAQFTAGALPALPQVGPPLAPGGAPVVNPASAPQWAIANQQLGNLGAQYAPLFAQAKAQAQYGLAGLGGYSFGTDNPATPQDESLNLSYDPNHALGDKERKTYLGAVAGTRASLLGSSFANRNIGAAFQQLSDQTRQTIMQYAGAVNGFLQQEQAQQGSIVDKLAGLYSTDVSWYANPDQPWNQPPPPAPAAPEPAPPTNDSGVYYDQPDYAQGPGTALPYGTGPVSETVNPTYAQFVQSHGGVSTAALAAAWRKRFGGG